MKSSSLPVNVHAGSDRPGGERLLLSRMSPEPCCRRLSVVNGNTLDTSRRLFSANRVRKSLSTSEEDGPGRSVGESSSALLWR